MNDAETNVATRPDHSVAEWRLPRRDYILLPLICVMTIIILLLGGEVAARLIYPQDDASEPCEYTTATGARYRPLCISHTKVWEGPGVTQQFNACGYRTAESCARRPAGSLRVAVVGSSMARGALVNYPDSFAARASAYLSDRCGGVVDFQNLGSEPTDVDRIDLRIPEALALKPAAIVMTIGAYDLIHLKDPPPLASVPETHAPAADRLANSKTAGTVAEPPWSLKRAVGLLRQSRLFLVMQYFLYRDPAFQIRAFLLNQDAADYVRAPLTAAWDKRIEDFGALLRRIDQQTSVEGVPVLLVYVPERAQAALAALPVRPPGVDPFVLGRALAQEAARDGIQFVDATSAFAAAPDFQSLFYLTDGHPREGGHAAIASVVERELLTGRAFAACNQTNTGGRG